ncbi:unnamed protein product [Allacma fusca]|uniref:RING-type domain-containing protein n=1 Tax=Allacma fusca TaxID=39272 RepID=A0A8J2LHN1_9HEXA|nr:unnamed protein product [Allacma fusca]
MRAHEHVTCEEAQNGRSDVVVRCLKEIHEQIFNLACPRCNLVFSQFEGCAAVTCSSCKCAFCGICLQDCGSNAHSHVKETCSKNPRKGQYYIDEDQLNRIHKEMRVKKLKEYLGLVDDEEIRYGILRACMKDLIDLGIDCKEFEPQV